MSRTIGEVMSAAVTGLGLGKNCTTWQIPVDQINGVIIASLELLGVKMTAGMYLWDEKREKTVAWDFSFEVSPASEVIPGSHVDDFIIIKRAHYTTYIASSLN